MAKKKEMNRTAGTAKRKISQAEEVRFGMKTGKPLTGSASGVKSISLKQAGEALTQGIVTTRGGKLQFAPEGLAMALPTGKVAKAAGLLLGKGKIFPATGLVKRLTAKDYGRSAAKEIARNAKTPNMAQQAAQDSYERVTDLIMSGKSARGKSKSVFPPTSSIKSSPAGTFRQAQVERNIAKGAYKAVKFGPNPAYKAAAKEIARSKMAKGVKGSAPYMESLLNPLFKKSRGK
jgi:hypothetical protein